MPHTSVVSCPASDASRYVQSDLRRLAPRTRATQVPLPCRPCERSGSRAPPRPSAAREWSAVIGLRHCSRPPCAASDPMHANLVRPHRSTHRTTVLGPVAQAHSGTYALVQSSSTERRLWARREQLQRRRSVRLADEQGRSRPGNRLRSRKSARQSLSNWASARGPRIAGPSLPSGAGS
jgi:hypothetical protein